MKASSREIRIYWVEGARAALKGRTFEECPYFGSGIDERAGWWVSGYWWAQENRQIEIAAGVLARAVNCHIDRLIVDKLVTDNARTD